MSEKLILIIDNQETCLNCPLVLSGLCQGGKRSFHEVWLSEKRHESCPLKPLPEKRHYSDEIADEKGNDMYMEGWNDCLKEITGESNG